MWTSQNGMASNRWPNWGKGPPLFIPSISSITLARNAHAKPEPRHIAFRKDLSSRISLSRRLLSQSFSIHLIH